MFLVADLITAAIVVPLFAGLWGFMTQIGAVSGVIAGFGSVIIQGWELRKAIAQGFEQIGLPKGLYSDETVVSFVLAVASSAVVGFGVSALERMYANTVRTRRYVELLADAGNVDLASHEHEFVNLVDFKGGKNVDSTEGSVEAEV